MISADQFKSRLEVLCLRGGGRGLPRKPRDRHILFKSIVLMLDPEKIYSETEINRGIETWLAEIGQTVEIDHVTLRRHLVDEGYLKRDNTGATYKVSTEEMSEVFDPAIDSLVPELIIVAAREHMERKKRD